MASYDSQLKFWDAFIYFSVLVVIIGVIGESSELLIKWGWKKTFRQKFGKVKRREFVIFLKWLRPRILKVETLGFGILIIGLALELLVTLRINRIANDQNLAIEKAQAKIDPNKNPIFSVSGYIFVLVKPGEPDRFLATNGVGFGWASNAINFPIHIKGGNENPVMLIMGNSQEMQKANDVNEAFIESDNVTKSSCMAYGDKVLRFDIYFGMYGQEKLPDWDFSNSSLTPDDFDAVDFVLPVRGKVVAGNVNLLLDNGAIRKNFQVPAQEMVQYAVTSVMTNGAFIPMPKPPWLPHH